jgi:hypothetical protein
MRVNTDLKSGNVINDAANLVNQGAAQVTGFVSAADKQARAVTKTVTNTAQSAWNSLTSWLRIW